jgi:hypothetical protein
MTEPEYRIAKAERELAEYQTQTIPCQLEAGLVRERLKTTLDIAMRTIDCPAKTSPTEIS